jgi:hypothetical protein
MSESWSTKPSDSRRSGECSAQRSNEPVLAGVSKFLEKPLGKVIKP